MDEDEPGQRVVFAQSSDGMVWTAPTVLFPNMSTSHHHGMCALKRVPSTRHANPPPTIHHPPLPCNAPPAPLILLLLLLLLLLPSPLRI